MRVPEPERGEEADSILPLINVVFLLLIFFMMVGALQGIDVFEVEPPLSSGAGENRDERPTVLIGADGRLALDDRELDVLDLQLAVSDLLYQRPDLLVRVKADLKVEARRVVEVMELLNAVGVERVLLLSLEAKG